MVMGSSSPFLKANDDGIVTSPMYLKGKGNGVVIAASSFSLKWSGDGMPTWPCYLRKKDNGMITSSPFSLKGCVHRKISMKSNQLKSAIAQGPFGLEQRRQSEDFV